MLLQYIPRIMPIVHALFVLVVIQYGPFDPYT